MYVQKFPFKQNQRGNQKWIDAIEKDLHRNFPTHELFGGVYERIGQSELYRVLKAYSVLNPVDGYCQAMAPIAALLLMNMPAEQAFWDGINSLQLETFVTKTLLSSVLPTSIELKMCPNQVPGVHLRQVHPRLLLPRHGGHPARRGHPPRAAEARLPERAPPPGQAGRRADPLHDGVVPLRVRPLAAVADGVASVGHFHVRGSQGDPGSVELSYILK